MHIVCGPPASGKSTYVRENAHSGDLVVDFDEIKRCFVFGVKKAGSAGDFHILCELVRERVYSWIQDYKGRFDVWIIESLPRHEEREEIARRLSCNDMILLDPGESVCVWRAMHDEEREDKDLQIKIIGEWYDRYTDSGFFSDERWD